MSHGFLSWVFRKSSVWNDDFLQPEMISHFNNKFKQLCLDCKTRWTSLKKMLKDFLDHWLYLFACETIGRPFELSNEDIEKLKELSNILSIFELYRT